MASSSSKRRRTYDVFLSFRGTDVRNSFVSHLYSALDRSGLFTYEDSEELRKGEQISPALMEAIEESRIAIVVFSENYASSAWCLDELAKIMECKGQRDLIVIPVFYKVDPKEVRTPRHGQRYAQAMADHEVKKPEKVEKWKKALLDAGRLSGWHFTDGDEAELIKDIVRGISSQLDPKRLDVARYPVGIDSRVEELKRLLNLDSKDDVLMVGLWGQGGVGKTTLAKAIYNAIFREFDGSGFLERVRENSKNSSGENSKNSSGLVHLQEKLLSMLLLGKTSTIYSVDEGIPLLQDRLCNKKILVILDDVDHECQLNALAGNCEWFGKGSRIIITTRDRHMLTRQGVNYIYEVKALKATEASKLLIKHAFPGNELKIRRDLVDSVLHYAKGLPLALEVVGSSLRGRGEDEWKSTLRELADCPKEEINDVLKLSYEKLEKSKKEIFLDIACFFKGWRRSYIEKILDCCGFATTIGIQVLIERTLIKEEDGILQMHDLIQLMGMDIVKEKRNDPRQWSRLWLYDDISNVLSGNTVTYEVNAIVLKLPKSEKMEIDPHAFENMKELRLLILHNVRNSSQVAIYLPNKLRWLEWPRCASTLRFSPGDKELVGLDLRESEIGRVEEQFEDFIKLKFINLSGCQWLVHMPNLSFTTDLEELNLSECKNLERVHKSVTHLGKLRSLNLSGCSRLPSLPGVLQSKQLRSLTLANCSKLQRFPIIPNNTKFLWKLDLEGTSIRELPTSVGNLVYLSNLNLDNCKELSVLPSSIYRLRNLGNLGLGGCSKLIKFPKKEEIESDPHMKTGFPKLNYLYLKNCNLSEVEFLENSSCFPSLSILHLEGNNFTSLPACRHLDNLSYLGLNENNQLQEICEIPGKLREVYAKGCKSLSKIPFNIGDVDILDLSYCYKLVKDVPAIYDWFERTCTKKELISFTLPGGEMPKWLIPNDDGYISLMVSKNLRKKFLRVVVCVVFRVKEGEREAYLIVDGPSNIGFLTDRVSCVDWNSIILCRGYEFLGSNDWRCLKVTVRASASVIVKKCGFRIICKPLGNDWEVFLRHNQSFNPDLLYEVGHEGSQMSSWEEIPSETEDSQETKASTEEGRSQEGSQMSISEENSSETEDLQESETRREKDSSSEGNSSMAGISIEEHRYSLIGPCFRNVCPGGEIPKKFILVEDGTISFKASQNLYDKIGGLALCAIFGVEDEEKKVSFSIVPSINGQRRNALSGTLGSSDTNHVWIQFLQSNALWGLLEGGIDFGQFDESYLEFKLRIEVSGGTMKKLGYAIICRQLEDDLKVVIEDNQLVNLASLWEESCFPEEPCGPLDVGPAYKKLVCWWRDFRKKLEANIHIEEPEASDSGGEPDQRWSGDSSSDTD